MLYAAQPVPGSNCTFMELKFTGNDTGILRYEGSNCTFMELKS